MSALLDDARQRLTTARSRIAGLDLTPRLHEIGIVREVGDGVVTLSGLASTRLDEVLELAGGARAMAVRLDIGTIGAVLLDRGEEVLAGSQVRGTGEVVRVPVGPALLGRVVDPLGRPRDGGPPLRAERLDPIERPAPGIIDRELVAEPLYTGILAIDALLPIGRGQRELIIGDRTTGKTAIGLDAILNQRRSDVVCVYAAIGQKASSVGRVLASVRASGPFERCVFVVAESDDPVGLQWIAPYAACAIAEAFRDAGQHALLVIDDLTKHAIVHRQISLLLRDPPGREAYPGDIFYVHARLLERAARLSAEKGGGSLTALPIAETQAGNLSAYIPTNLISITDGQIDLETRLFNEGQKPAIATGKSVSRVGAKTQAPAMKHLAESLRLDYAQFLELEVFTRFGQAVDARTAATITHGERIRAVFRQSTGAPYALSTEIALLVALREGVLDPVPLPYVTAFLLGIEDDFAATCPGPAGRIDASGDLSDADRAEILVWARARVVPPPAAS